MLEGRNELRLIFILAEACLLYPLYQLASFGLGRGVLLPFWLFSLLAVLLLLLNLQLNLLRYRNLLLVFVNAVIMLIAVVILGQVNTEGSWAIYLTGAFLAILIIRSIYFAVKSSLDVFLHFDLNLVLIFLILLLAGSLNLPLASGVTWLMFSVLLNIATLSLARSRKQGKLAWVGVGVATVILLPLFFLARYFLPLLFAPAQFLYAVGKPIAYTFRNIIGSFLSFYVTYLAEKREANSNLTTDTSKVEILGNKASESAAVNLIMKIIIGIFFVVMAIAALALLLYLLRLLLSWFLRKQGKTLPAILRSENKFSWSGLWRGWLLFWGRLMVLLLPWLPIKLDIPKAYRALLKWGSYRSYPRKKDETPNEYLRRLEVRFPQHQEDLSTLTNYYVQYKYGQNNYGENISALYTSGDLKMTLRRLFLPRLSAFSAALRNR